MKLWLVCFSLLFMVAEGVQWFAAHQWFSEIELSLPVVVAAGLLLAWASNQDWTVRKSSLPGNAPHQTTGSLPHPPQMPPPVAKVEAKPTLSPRKSPSISFEIPKKGQQRSQRAR